MWLMLCRLTLDWALCVLVLDMLDAGRAGQRQNAMECALPAFHVVVGQRRGIMTASSRTVFSQLISTYLFWSILVSEAVVALGAFVTIPKRSVGAGYFLK